MGKIGWIFASNLDWSLLENIERERNQGGWCLFTGDDPLGKMKPMNEAFWKLYLESPLPRGLWNLYFVQVLLGGHGYSYPKILDKPLIGK